MKVLVKWEIVTGRRCDVFTNWFYAVSLSKKNLTGIAKLAFCRASLLEARPDSKVPLTVSREAVEEFSGKRFIYDEVLYANQSSNLIYNQMMLIVMCGHLVTYVLCF